MFETRRSEEMLGPGSESEIGCIITTPPCWVRPGGKAGFACPKAATAPMARAEPAKDAARRKFMVKPEYWTRCGKHKGGMAAIPAAPPCGARFHDGILAQVS
jgi:hypothetical protein